MTPDEMLEKWRKLLAVGAQVTIHHCKNNDSQTCHIEYRRYERHRQANGSHPDPLRAFEQAYTAYQAAVTEQQAAVGRRQEREEGDGG